MEIEIRKHYHGNDQLYKECSYLNDIQHGLQRRWYINGNLDAHWYFKNGMLHGIGQWWYSNGTRQDIEGRKNHTNHGPSISFKYN